MGACMHIQGVECDNCRAVTITPYTLKANDLVFPPSAFAAEFAVVEVALIVMREDSTHAALARLALEALARMKGGK